MAVTKEDLIERTEALLPGIAARARESEELSFVEEASDGYEISGRASFSFHGFSPLPVRVHAH